MEKLVKDISAGLYKAIDAASRIIGMRNKIPPAPLAISLIEKGYIHDSGPWQSNLPYIWRFEVSGDELVVIHNSGTRDAMWVSYLNNRREYNGNYAGILRRYPYLYDHIEYL